MKTLVGDDIGGAFITAHGRLDVKDRALVGERAIAQILRWGGLCAGVGLCRTAWVRDEELRFT
jgi:hypothetical protein